MEHNNGTQGIGEGISDAGLQCPYCGNNAVSILVSTGAFDYCSNYPECTWVSSVIPHYQALLNELEGL